MPQNKNIDQLNAANPLTGDENIALRQAGVTLRTTLAKVLALGGGETVLFDAGTISSGTPTFDYANGAYQKASITADSVVQAPLHPAVLSRLELYITASGADRTIDFHPSITIPTDSSLILPKTLTSGKSYIVMLKSYNGTSWNLISVEGGF